jgi:putative transposase
MSTFAPHQLGVEYLLEGSAQTDDELRNWARQVRHGHLPEREIMTGIGPVAARCPCVNASARFGAHPLFVGDFAALCAPAEEPGGADPDPLSQGRLHGDFEEALVALLGKDAGGLSAATIGRLKEAWSEEHARWSKRDLSAKR